MAQGYIPTGDYYKDSYHRESKGDYKANRPGSQFYGLGQFAEKFANPYLEKMGKTWEDYKTDPAVQHDVMKAETAWIDKRLQARGQEVNNQNRGMIHNIGIGNWDKMNKPGAESNTSLMTAIRGQAGSPQTIAAYKQHMADTYGGPGNLTGESTYTPQAGGSQSQAPVEALVSPPATTQDIALADSAQNRDRELLLQSMMNAPTQMPIGQSPNPSLTFGNNIGLRQLLPDQLGLGAVK